MHRSIEIPVPPVCPYCNERVGDNEFDVESRGYFSTHTRCTERTPDGPFWVASLLDGEPYRDERRGYRSLRRAESVADDLARTNTGRWAFVVYDGNKLSTTFDGRLPRR